MDDIVTEKHMDHRVFENYLALSQGYLASGRAKEAMRPLRAYLKLRPQDVTALALQDECLARLELYAEPKHLQESHGQKIRKSGI